MVDRANRPSALNAPKSSGPSAQVDIVGEGGSQKVVASLPSGESVEVYLFGATVTSWKSNGGKTENLWVSESADLTGKKPIRGGVPVVFPVRCSQAAQEVSSTHRRTPSDRHDRTSDHLPALALHRSSRNTDLHATHAGNIWASRPPRMH